MNRGPLETLSAGRGARGDDRGTTMSTTTGDEQVISGVMDRWKARVDGHEPDQVAACFTEDAIFQGMRPYTVGRQGWPSTTRPSRRG